MSDLSYTADSLIVKKTEELATRDLNNIIQTLEAKHRAALLQQAREAQDREIYLLTETIEKLESFITLEREARVQIARYCGQESPF